MNREVQLYFEDAYPGFRKRWYATARDGKDVELACGFGDTANEALEDLGMKLIRARNAKRDARRSR